MNNRANKEQLVSDLNACLLMVRLAADIGDANRGKRATAAVEESFKLICKHGNLIRHLALDDSEDHLIEMLNDRSISPYLQQWIDYPANHMNRLKLIHDLRLKDGTELLRYRPNANAWFKMFEGPGPERVSDEEVAFIRLSINQGWKT